MCFLNKPDIVPFNDLILLGVAIKNVSPSQNHVGIIYRLSETGDISFLHLAWHWDLRKETPKEDYYWVQAFKTGKEIDEHDLVVLRNLSAYCELISNQKSNRRIPYGLGYEKDCFDSLGKWQYDIEGEGLTCATFILSIFESHGYSLLDIDNWEKRDDDFLWQEYVIKNLEISGASIEHINFQKNYVENTFRFRPEEIVAGVYLNHLPTSFKDATQKGKEINHKITK